jgi:hypothetical protein
MKARNSSPAWVIAAALAFGVIAFSLILSLFDWSRNPALFGYAWLLRTWLEGIAVLMPAMLLAGVPIGLLHLKGRKAGLNGWARTGMLAAIAGTLVLYVYTALAHGVEALSAPEGWGPAFFAIPIGLMIGCLAWPVARWLVRD